MENVVQSTATLTLAEPPPPYASSQQQQQDQLPQQQQQYRQYSRNVQAVTPFAMGSNANREPIVNIPSDSKVVKHLVRDMAAGQFSEQQQQQELTPDYHQHRSQSVTRITPTLSPSTSYKHITSSTTAGIDHQHGTGSQPNVSCAEPRANSIASLQMPRHFELLATSDDAVNRTDACRLHPASSSSGVSTSVESLAHTLNPEYRRVSRLLAELQKENDTLRTQLQAQLTKSLRVQQLELNYERLQREYEDLMRRQHKSDQLSDQYRHALNNEINRLNDQNRMLEEQLSMRAHECHMDEQDTMARHELGRLNLLLTQLMQQNKELLAAKERQDIELQAQNTTLEEQRAHIHILDKALKNAQAKVLRLEEDRETKQSYVGQLEQLVEQLKTANQHMQDMQQQHRHKRNQLEHQLTQMQMHKNKDNQSPSVRLQLPANDDLVNKLRRELDAKNDELLQLSQKNVQYEARLCQMAKQNEQQTEADNHNRTAHIQKLEEDVEKSRAEATEARAENEKCRVNIRDLKASVTELENKVQSLEAANASKDAMIKVLKCGHKYEQAAGFDIVLTAKDGSVDVDRSRLNAARKRFLEPASRQPQHSWSPSYDYSSLGRPIKPYGYNESGLLHEHTVSTLPSIARTSTAAAAQLSPVASSSRSHSADANLLLSNNNNNNNNNNNSATNQHTQL